MSPQRIEQRIGRCHRYGQKHDVMVINFINEKNGADQRVLELLTDKFNLFSGVFGASDEILGTIESGLDFEKRILSIYQICRTPSEIQAAFDTLQQEMKKDISQEHLYRLTHPFGEYVLAEGKNCQTPQAEVVLDITNHPTQISMIEAIKGQSGWLILDLLRLESFQEEEHLVFTGLNDTGLAMDQEICEKLFGCYLRQKPVSLGSSAPAKLTENAKQHQKAVFSRIMESNNRFFQAERDKLERWADDKILAVELALTDTKAKIRGLKREARPAETVEQQKEYQEKIRDLERKQRRQRQQIFDAEDEILDKRDELIDALEKRMTKKTENKRLFNIRCSVA